MNLLDLPPETLTLILTYLSAVYLPTLLVSQSTCTRLRALIQHIISNPPSPISSSGAPTHNHNHNYNHNHDDGDSDNNTPSNPLLSIHPLLHQNFAPLLNTQACFPPSPAPAPAPAVRRRFLDGERELPFRRAPWAATAATREPFLRRGASWRRLGVSFGAGPGITRLEVVKTLVVQINTVHTYHEVEVPSSSSSGLTMGFLYDMLLASPFATWGVDTTNWRLFPGRRLRSFDEFQLEPRWGVDKFGAEMIVGGDEARHCAVLYVDGFRGCMPNIRKHDGSLWYPKPIGDTTFHFHAWQGCKPRR